MPDHIQPVMLPSDAKFVIDGDHENFIAIRVSDLAQLTNELIDTRSELRAAAKRLSVLERWCREAAAAAIANDMGRLQ